MNLASTRSQRALARRLAEVAFAAPQVIAHRTGRMVGANPSARDRREMNRMVTEKTAALSEAWWAMSMQAMRVNLAFSSSFLRSPFTPLSPARASAAIVSVFGAGFAPVHRRAVANAKRLARVR